MASLSKTGFEKWQDGINKAPMNGNWHVWDCDLRRAVDEYNQHLSDTAGYVPLDWQLIKAMAWTFPPPWLRTDITGEVILTMRKSSTTLSA